MHSHSNFSDGIYSPEELLELAQKEDLKLFSITDHDTLEGTIVAEKIADNYSFAYLTGIELSARYEQTKIEILGYNLDSKSTRLFEKMTFLQEKRNERVFKILKKLEEMNLDVTYDDISKQIGGGVSPGRPHLARAMIEKKIVKTINEAFEKYLGNGKPAYVKRETIAPQEAIELILSGNGTAVLPHPLLVEGENLQKLEEYLELLMSWKLDGIEVYYDYNHIETFLPKRKIKAGIEFLSDYCKKNDLLITGGSDFHGDTGKLGSVKIPKEEIKNIFSYFNL
ncbi:MAG: PHP domain-containing protein [Candidatus Heimdallarchaeota archaeon]|nr:PHP domain-containing protein [Candidatus Heimdallarchaeota archaeon]MCG3255137.1 PHP domain-containing protein [Candidatus Heimdallarchaeota archaeon]MCK4610210.1 PHP domain-containing protein [Candidatus Heimdallarchaeota archaeon]